MLQSLLHGSAVLFVLLLLHTLVAYGSFVASSCLSPRLQDEVVETIADVKAAGVKVWVLTGDKLETAISIAHSCSLLTDATYNAVVDGKSQAAVREQLHQYMNYVVAAQLAADAFEAISFRSVRVPPTCSSGYCCFCLVVFALLIALWLLLVVCRLLLLFVVCCPLDVSCCLLSNCCRLLFVVALVVVLAPVFAFVCVCTCVCGVSSIYFASLFRLSAMSTPLTK